MAGVDRLQFRRYRGGLPLAQDQQCPDRIDDHEGRVPTGHADQTLAPGIGADTALRQNQDRTQPQYVARQQGDQHEYVAEMNPVFAHHIAPGRRWQESVRPVAALASAKLAQHRIRSMRPNVTTVRLPELSALSSGYPREYPAYTQKLWISLLGTPARGPSRAEIRAFLRWRSFCNHSDIFI